MITHLDTRSPESSVPILTGCYLMPSNLGHVTNGIIINNNVGLKPRCGQVEEEVCPDRCTCRENAEIYWSSIGRGP